MSGSKFLGSLTRFSLVLLASLASSAACKKSAPKAKATKTQSLQPLRAKTPRFELPVAGFSSAVVSLPLGVRSPRPVVIGLHAASDSASALCDRLRKLAGDHLFVLCPQGKAPKFEFVDPGATSNELRAALAALKQRFSAHVAKGPAMLMGFETGAEHAAHIAREEPAFFSRVALVASGQQVWSAAHASIFGQRGGKKLLFVCFTRVCQDEAELRAVFTRRSGADVHVAFPGELGKVSDPRLWTLLASEWAWFVQGDNRWKVTR